VKSDVKEGLAVHTPLEVLVELLYRNTVVVYSLKDIFPHIYIYMIKILIQCLREEIHFYDVVSATVSA
jgi:hypothetical protein